MKKHFITASLLLVLTAGCVHAQAVRTSLVSHGRPAKDSSSTAGLSAKTPHLNEFNVHATRDFMKRFKDPKDVKWSKASGGYIVAFTIDSIKSRTAYNSSGEWVYTIRYYNEWKLPKEVRAQVKSTYYDYTITQVEEIIQSIQNEPSYLIHMKDDKSWKNVLVCNGEMTVVEDYDK
jgi:hypothetical protein